MPVNYSFVADVMKKYTEILDKEVGLLSLNLMPSQVFRNINNLSAQLKFELS